MKQRMVSIIGLAFLFQALLVAAQGIDTQTVWPLCGRITEDPPPAWLETDGCPVARQGDPTFSDAPYSSTFGPRLLFSGADRYDFHRGVDIATPIGTPFFAITDGNVEIAGDHPDYSDPLIKLRHYRPGENTCSNGGGCYHSYYLHISDWFVDEDDWVAKGQLLGYTGESGSGFDHLHFEIRDAPAWDPFSAWSRDAVHPFTPLPYCEPNESSISFNSVNTTDPNAVVANLTVRSNRYDLVNIEMRVFDQNNQEVVQTGNTANVNGYHVEPAFWDMETWNFEYSHKNSSSYPWSSFGSGGAQECPYHADHGPSYSAHVHMDQADPGDFQKGLFNGVQVTTNKYWLVGDRHYEVGIEFRELEGPAACIEASAVFASGDITTRRWGACPPTCMANRAIVADRWESFALPCDSGEANQVQQIFSGLPAGEYNSSWVVWRYDSNTGGYVKMAADDSMWPGLGYWIYTLNSTVISYMGHTNTTGHLILASDALSGKLNFVGNVHNATIDWPDVKVVAGVAEISISEADPWNNAPPPAMHECDINPAGDDCLVSRIMYKWSGNNFDTFNGETPGLEGELNPGDAIWVKAFRPGAKLRLPDTLPQSSPMAARHSSVPVKSDAVHAGEHHNLPWYIRLIATAGNKRDRGNVLGQLAGSGEGADSNDVEELRPFGSSYLSLVFVNPEFPAVDWGYTSDFRSITNKPRGTWPILIRSSDEEGEITLSWEGEDSLFRSARLRDEQTGKLTTLKPGGSYTFSNQGGENRFTLYFR